MDIDAIREAINDWLLLVVGVLGLIAAWEKAKGQIMTWAGNLNLWERMHKVETGLDEVTSMAHAHKEAQP